jgi:hypothetical protein
MLLSLTQINEAKAILEGIDLTEIQRVQNFYTYLINKGEDYGRLGLTVPF